MVLVLLLVYWAVKDYVDRHETGGIAISLQRYYI